MSTTVELVRANERYARLRAAIGALADEWEAAQGRHELNGERWQSPHVRELRALLAAVDS